MSECVIGIDLGTTYSVAAYVDESGRPQVIPDADGSVLLPSIASFLEDGSVLVGNEAKKRRVTSPTLTISSVKRLMGKGSNEIEVGKDFIPYLLDLSDEKIVRIRLGGKSWTPPEISALFLKKLKERAEAFFKTAVTSAVITVPAYFNDSQRQATKDAGKIAGLEVMRIVNEPTAASLAYGLHKRNRGKIAVYDLGGGTFDISILNLHDGIFEVLSTAGDTHLGGDDLDWCLAKQVIQEIEKSSGKPVSADLELVQSIVEASERVKIELSKQEAAALKVERPNQGVLFNREISRNEFEALIRPIAERTVRPCRQALKDAALETKEIDEVVLVGGSTRIPLVRSIAESAFGKKPHSELNPDEVVALGAAVQAHILTGKMKDLLLLDVTPLSLGIETYGGAVARIIERNSKVPARASEVFTTFVDGQTSVDLHILQGERELAKDCRSLARFQLKGIDPMPAGLPRIDVTFIIDENGILQVRAKDQRGGREQLIEVKPTYGLTEDEVKQMVKASFEHAKDDFEAHLLIDVRNDAEIVVRATEKALKEVKAGVLADKEKKRIESALAKTKESLQGSDRKQIRDAMDHLNQETQHLAEMVVNEAIKKSLVGKRVDQHG